MEKMQPAPLARAASAAAPRKVLLLLFLGVLGVHLLFLLGQGVGRSAKEVKINRPFLVTSVAQSVAGSNATPPPAVKVSEPRAGAPKRASSVLPPAEANVVDSATGAKEGAASTMVSPDSAQRAEPGAQQNPVAASAESQAAAEIAQTASDTELKTAASALAQAAPTLIPGSLRLRYTILGEVRKMSYSAWAELLWLQDGKTYDARLEVGAFLLGKRVQTSTGRITEQGLAPKRFSDKARSEVAAHFEREKGKVIFSTNTPQADLQANAQDQLSIFVQVGSLIAAEPERYPGGSAIEMQAVGARDADTWRFVVDGPEVLSLPAGDMSTLKVTRPPRQQYDLTVELWLAPKLGYLPARIRLTQSNGDFIDQQLRSSETPQ